jgi:hypothetical protein
MKRGAGLKRARAKARKRATRKVVLVATVAGSSGHDELAGLARLVEDDVVYEAGLADARGDGDKDGAVVETVEAFERVGVVDADVFERGARFGFDVGADDLGEFFAVAFAFTVGGFGVRERAVENGGGAFVFGFEVGVARGEREAGVFAHGGEDDDLRVEGEVAHEAFDDERLLRVLLAEVGKVCADDVEEDGQDGGDATEVAGTRRTFELFG